MGTETAAASLAATFVGHTTVLIEVDGARILTDPLLRLRVGTLARHSPLPPAFNARFGRWPLAFTRYAAHLAPGVDVRALEPGATTRIDGALRERAVP